EVPRAEAVARVVDVPGAPVALDGEIGAPVAVVVGGHRVGVGKAIGRVARVPRAEAVRRVVDAPAPGGGVLHGEGGAPVAVVGGRRRPGGRAAIAAVRRVPDAVGASGETRGDGPVAGQVAGVVLHGGVDGAVAVVVAGHDGPAERRCGGDED